MDDNVVKIRLLPNGPLRVENGQFQIEKPDGTIVEKRAPFSLCRCGHSKVMPFCDASHKETGFEG